MDLDRCPSIAASVGIFHAVKAEEDPMVADAKAIAVCIVCQGLVVLPADRSIKNFGAHGRANLLAHPSVDLALPPDRLGLPVDCVHTAMISVRYVLSTVERYRPELRRLTFELTGPQRQDALARLAKMYRVPPTGPRWPAVAGPVERGVRRQLASPSAETREQNRRHLATQSYVTQDEPGML